MGASDVFRQLNHLNIVEISLEMRQYPLDAYFVFIVFTAVDTQEVGLMQFLMYYLATCEWLSSKCASGKVLIVLLSKTCEAVNSKNQWKQVEFA